jgi:hypothetical protein
MQINKPVYLGFQWLPVIILAIMLFKRVLGRLNWTQVKEQIEVYRVCPVVKGSIRIPYLSTIKEFDSIVNYRIYKPSRERKAHIKPNEQSDKFKELAGTYIIGPVFDSVIPIVFKRSKNNEFISLKTRVLLDPGTNCNITYFLECAKAFEDDILHPIYRFKQKVNNYEVDFEQPQIVDIRVIFDSPIPYVTKSFEQYCNTKRFPPSRVKQICDWREKVAMQDFNIKQFTYSTFIKKEKLMLVTNSDYEPARPRAIQGVSNLAKALYGQWFYNYSLVLKSILHYNHQFWYCNGAKNSHFTKWIHNAFSKMRKYVAISIDFSKFDVTQSPAVINNENNWYLKIGFPINYVSKAFLKSKLMTKGYSNWFKYKILGTRKSGDSDTSSGNTRITMLVIYSFLKNNKFVRYFTAANGDDSLQLLDYYEIMNKFKSLPIFIAKYKEHISKLGFIPKLHCVLNITKTEFLSSKFYKVDGVYYIGLKPGRVFHRLGFLMRKMRTWSKNEAKRLLRGTLISLKPTASFVPFLGSYINLLEKYLLKHKPIFNIESKRRLERKDDKYPKCPAPDTWNDFTVCYGLCRQDEKNFLAEVESNIKRHGLSFIMHSRCVATMWQVEESANL